MKEVILLIIAFIVMLSLSKLKSTRYYRVYNREQQIDVILLIISVGVILWTIHLEWYILSLMTFIFLMMETSRWE